MDNENGGMAWSFYNVWNQSLENRAEKQLRQRDNMWASELGGSMIDRYLKMKAVPYTNPPNPRSLRKFEAGNMMEWLVGMVLKRAGVLLEDQSWVSFQYPGFLKVTGKLDFLAGGVPDWLAARQEIMTLGLPDFFKKATNQIIDYLSSKFPDGLKKIVLEIKSCSSFMFELYEKRGANKSHRLQLFHYLKAKGFDEGHVVYIYKDDLRMLEIGVHNPSITENEYRQDIEAITHYLRSDTQPPLEELILFEDDKFNINWKVQYSNYLTKLYGFKEPSEYEDEYRSIVSRWNRVLKRCADGKKMTKKNVEVIGEIKTKFPNHESKGINLTTSGIITDKEDDDATDNY